MSENFIWLAIVVGSLVSIFLFRFSFKTWNKIQRIEDAKKAYLEEVAEKKDKALNSIKVIAQCMLDEQVELSEGCIRIKVLLDHLAPNLHEDERFSVFIKMYDALEHMPTHEARKQTDKRVIFKLDQERFKLEEDNQHAILSASKALLE
ncbi:hypothetical protein A3735_24670, partial [Oleiphilus sp. HI0061]